MDRSRAGAGWLAALWTVVAAAGCAAHAPLDVVPRLELPRYLGTWYEIAHLPFRWQKGCHATTATYSLRPDGDVRVVNRCRKGSLDGRESSYEGRAWVVDRATGARLKVSFFWPFRGDYWVIDLDADYRWAVVATPDRRYLWILSRTPTLDAPTVEGIKARAAAAGFPVERLLPTPQE